ncbi:hypothetical protein FGIG_11183 [Fasciola gigantica]|uniref:Uncharacterized protein n=1 Tax=Fasciola gigantica TaxID=46835 RepID=A0A504YHN6_FASGI|nr:hypothetical protein FGIG_11183 [Fasciola gigantica]
MQPINPMNRIFTPQVSYVPSVVRNRCTPTITPTYFQPFQLTNDSALFPQSTLEEPNAHTVSVTGIGYPYHITDSSGNGNHSCDPSVQKSPTSPTFSRPQSVEAVVKDDAKQLVQGPIQCVSSPLRSILKSHPSTTRNSPERLPGFYENFSELTALRTRDSIELAPTHLRLNSARDWVSSPREPSPDTMDGSETERSVTPRTTRKTVRFVDQMGDSLRRRANSTCNSGVDGFVPSVVNKPRSRSMPVSPTPIKADDPVGHTAYLGTDNSGRMGVVYPSTSFDAPMRNTILPSLGSNHPQNRVSSPNALDSFRSTEMYPVCETTPPKLEFSASAEDRSKPNQGKPPIKSQQKISAPARFNRTGKVGYADLFNSRPNWLSEQKSVVATRNTSNSATINTSTSVQTANLELVDSGQNSLSSSPPMFTEQELPVHLRIPSIRSMSGPPTVSRRDLKERKTSTKIVDTAKLNEITRATSESRQIGPGGIQKEIYIPSAFNALRLTCPPTASEKDKLAAITRMTELNYETSLTSTDPSLSVQPSQAIPNLPDYEGMDVVLSGRLKPLKQGQAFQHAIYLSGQRNMNQNENCCTNNTKLVSTSVKSYSNNYQGDHGGSTSSIDSCAGSASNMPSQTLPEGDQFVTTTQPVHRMENKSLPPSGRLLTRRPQANTSSRSAQVS